jgi:hypothetical protein
MLFNSSFLKRTCNPGFDIKKNLVGSLGVGLSPILQIYKPMILVLVAFFNSRSFGPNEKTKHVSMYVLTFHKATNFTLAQIFTS